jgi:hypothetical protein
LYFAYYLNNFMNSLKYNAGSPELIEERSVKSVKQRDVSAQFMSTVPDVKTKMVTNIGYVRKIMSLDEWMLLGDIDDLIHYRIVYEGKILKVRLPAFIKTPSFGSEMQRSFSCVCDGKIRTITGSKYLIQKARPKLDGELVYIVKIGVLSYALHLGKKYIVEGRVGRYEKFNGKFFDLDHIRVQKIKWIDNNVYEVMPRGWVEFDDLDKIGNDGAIVLVGGVQYKFKNKWTMDLDYVTYESLGGNDIMFEGICEFDMDFNFVRSRPDKTRGENPIGLMNADSVSLFIREKKGKGESVLDLLFSSGKDDFRQSELGLDNVVTWSMFVNVICNGLSWRMEDMLNYMESNGYVVNQHLFICSNSFIPWDLVHEKDTLFDVFLKEEKLQDFFIPIVPMFHGSVCVNQEGCLFKTTLKYYIDDMREWQCYYELKAKPFTYILAFPNKAVGKVVSISMSSFLHFVAMMEDRNSKGDHIPPRLRTYTKQKVKFKDKNKGDYLGNVGVGRSEIDKNWRHREFNLLPKASCVTVERPIDPACVIQDDDRFFNSAWAYDDVDKNLRTIAFKRTIDSAFINLDVDLECSFSTHDEFFDDDVCPLPVVEECTKIIAFVSKDSMKI